MPSPTETIATLAAAAGGNAVRAATAGDIIDGVQPSAVVEPATPDAAAAVLAAASASRLSVVIRGGGTKIGWGRVPAAVDVVLSTRRLSRIVAHAHGDLVRRRRSRFDLAQRELERLAVRRELPLANGLGGQRARREQRECRSGRRQA